MCETEKNVLTKRSLYEKIFNVFPEDHPFYPKKFFDPNFLESCFPYKHHCEHYEGYHPHRFSDFEKRIMDELMLEKLQKKSDEDVPYTEWLRWIWYLPDFCCKSIEFCRNKCIPEISNLEFSTFENVLEFIESLRKKMDGYYKQWDIPPQKRYFFTKEEIFYNTESFTKVFGEENRFIFNNIISKIDILREVDDRVLSQELLALVKLLNYVGIDNGPDIFKKVIEICHIMDEYIAYVPRDNLYKFAKYIPEVGSIPSRDRNALKKVYFSYLRLLSETYSPFEEIRATGQIDLKEGILDIVLDQESEKNKLLKLLDVWRRYNQLSMDNLFFNRLVEAIRSATTGEIYRCIGMLESIFRKNRNEESSQEKLKWILKFIYDMLLDNMEDLDKGVFYRITSIFSDTFGELLENPCFLEWKISEDPSFPVFARRVVDKFKEKDDFITLYRKLAKPFWFAIDELVEEILADIDLEVLNGLGMYNEKAKAKYESIIAGAVEEEEKEVEQPARRKRILELLKEPCGKSEEIIKRIEEVKDNPPKWLIRVAKGEFALATKVVETALTKLLELGYIK